MDTTIVHMTKEEAASFLKWRQFEKEFDLLVKTGVFGVQNGSAEIHFNSTGEIASIELHFAVFRKPKAPPIVAIVVDKKQEGV